MAGVTRSAGGGQISRKPKGRTAETEGQGVTSWSSDDLRVKYRAEREREEAYQAFRLEEQVAEALEHDYGEASWRYAAVRSVFEFAFDRDSCGGAQ